jgi:DNA replication protein DnaC
MDALHRSRSLLAAAPIRGCIPINPALSREAQFAQWLDSLAPQTCQQHKHTRLLLDDTATRRASLSRDDSESWYARYEDGDLPNAEAREKLYPFEAIFRCPACCCAFALCPPEFHQTSFETFDTSTDEQTNSLALCHEFAAQVNKNRCGFALLVGRTGTGKTRLACNIVRVLENRDALYVRQGTLTCALRATYRRKEVFLHSPQWRNEDNEAGDDNPPTPLDIVQKVRFLVLDEIGCTALAGDERLLLDELLKHRYEQRKPTILISNLPLTGTLDKPGLKEFLGDALTDRIREATGNWKFIVQLSGESYRRTTGENYLDGLG